MEDKNRKSIKNKELVKCLEDEDEEELGEEEKEKKMLALEVLMNLYKDDIDSNQDSFKAFFAQELVSHVEDMYDEDILASSLRNLIREKAEQERFFEKLEKRVRERAVKRIEDGSDKG